VIQEQKMKIHLAATEERLKVARDEQKAVEEKTKAQGQLLESTQQALSKRELSSSTVISSAVANAMAVVKNHLLDYDMEILRKDFTIDDAEQEALVNSPYVASHDFVS
jgi:hypothetical protein